MFQVLLVVLLSRVPVARAQPSFVEDDVDGWISFLVAVCAVLAGTWSSPSCDAMASESAGVAPRPKLHRLRMVRRTRGAMFPPDREGRPHPGPVKLHPQVGVQQGFL